MEGQGCFSSQRRVRGIVNMGAVEKHDAVVIHYCCYCHSIFSMEGSFGEDVVSISQKKKNSTISVAFSCWSVKCNANFTWRLLKKEQDSQSSERYNVCPPGPSREYDMIFFVKGRPKCA